MASAAERQFVTHVTDLMHRLGPVTARRMFGGYGIFLDGLMFALIVDRVLYLKADSDSAPAFQALGLEPFSYRRQGRWVSLGYCQAPEETLEDAERMSEWAGRAYAVALRARGERQAPRPR